MINRQLIDSLAQGDFKRSLKLLESGADPNTRVKPKSKPTWQEILQYLIHRATPPDDNSPTALMAICDNALRDLPNYPHTIPDDYLHDPQIPILAQSMLAHGADVNARDEVGRTALMIAAGFGRNDTMTILLEHDATIDLQDNDGETALHFATDDPESVKLLLKYHADPNLKEKSGATALLLASGEGSVDTVRILLEHGASIQVEADGWTPLREAVENDRVQMVQFLLDHHADISCKDEYKRGETLLQSTEAHAQTTAKKTIRELLVHAGAKEPPR